MMPKHVHDVPLHATRPSDRTYNEVKPFTVPSSTLVYVIPERALNLREHVLPEVRVQRIPTSLGMMRLMYEADDHKNGGWCMETWFEGKLVPVTRAAVGQRVFMFLDEKTPRALCAGVPGTGITHTVKSLYRITRESSWTLDYECGAATPRSPREGEHFERFENTLPTCKKCLEPTWRVFYVCEYKIFKVIEARSEKARKVTAQRDRKAMARPTRFDRVIDEVPAKVRVPVVLVTPEIEEPMGRDAKLDSRLRAAEMEREKREAFKRERRWK